GCARSAARRCPQPKGRLLEPRKCDHFCARWHLTPVSLACKWRREDTAYHPRRVASGDQPPVAVVLTRWSSLSLPRSQPATREYCYIRRLAELDRDKEGANR